MPQPQLFLGLSTETWAIAIATFLGPVMAIVITRWRDKVREVRSRKLAIFRTLLATRRQIINAEHVNAINLIEVDYYGVKNVEDSWRIYNAHLSIPTKTTPDERRVWDEKRNELLAKLIFAMSQKLGFKMSEIDIKNGGYSPDGWRYRDDRLGEIQEFALKIARGNVRFPITAAMYDSQPSPNSEPSM
ncbi:DUF6680 family protein [Rhodoblastus sp.]|uniref:DUF6680 family protein n=1 Tax=Rhodoblastus sp. TaxID=1962975 RepID=UPI003F9EB20D